MATADKVNVNRLRALLALTFSPSAGEAANARAMLARQMEALGIKSENELDDLLSSTPVSGREDLTDLGQVQTLTDWGLYVDSRQSRFLLMHLVAYTVGWDRWTKMMVRKRYRKYIFVGVTQPEADYVAEIFQIHSKGLEKAMLRLGVHTTQIGRASSRYWQDRQDAARMAYLTNCELFIPGREVKPATAEELDRDPMLCMARKMMWDAGREDTPVKHDRRIEPSRAGRTLSGSSSQGQGEVKRLSDGSDR